MTALSVVEVIGLVEPCTFPVGADWNGNTWEPERCGLPAVDDEDEPRCPDHLGIDPR